MPEDQKEDKPKKEEKRYKYYGQEYRLPVEAMAAVARVSVRFQKDVLKLHGLGYEGKIAEGWTMKQCFDHAGIKRGRRPTPKLADLDDAVAEVKRLRGLLLDLGVDPNG